MFFVFTQQLAEARHMEHVTNPIHLPCPDMAGCVNPDPKLTQNSLAMVAKLRAELKGRLKKKAKPFIPARLGGGVA